MLTSLWHLAAYARYVSRSMAADYHAWRLRRYWLAREVAIDPKSVLRLSATGQLQIGAGSTIGAYTIIDLLGDPAGPPGASGDLIIGQRVAVNEFNNLRAGGGGISIGDGCLVSQFVSIIASGHGLTRGQFMRDQPWDPARRGVTIGADVWLGAGSTVLPGVAIGEGAVVAAGAVVTRDVLPYSIVAGIPAQPIGQR